MNDDTHTHALEAMSSATSGLGIQALCIFKEPSKAPAGMFAEACADAERRKSSFFQPYAMTLPKLMPATSALLQGPPANLTPAQVSDISSYSCRRTLPSLADRASLEVP